MISKNIFRALRFSSIFTAIFIYFMPAIAQQDFGRSVIDDPSISIRCQQLIKKRKEKIIIRQKIEGLLARNKRLETIAPKNKVTVKDKLLSNQIKLKRELKLTNLKIKSMTENVVRKGCPGIRL